MSDFLKTFTKSSVYSLVFNIEDLKKEIVKVEEQNPQSEQIEQEAKIRTTSVVAGKDPRIKSKLAAQSPDFFLIEILKDGVKDPYLTLNWRMSHQDIELADIVGFNVYRRKRRIDESQAVFFDEDAFDKIAEGSKRTGKFSQHKKAIYKIRRGLVPKSILNNNLNELEQNARSRAKTNFNVEEPIITQSQVEKSERNEFVKLAYVDLSVVVAKKQQKKVYVREKSFLDLTYDDKTIGYGQAFEYYITSVSKDSSESARSRTINVEIRDDVEISPPKDMFVKQVNEKQIKLSIRIEPRDQVTRAIIFRKSDEEVDFRFLGNIKGIKNNTLNLIDNDVSYTRTYTYRVFLQNIHGVVSEPKQITIYSSVQKVTPQSRSNNLKIPIINAFQDQNSDYVKIVISPNDKSIAYFELTRRDVTIHEKSFKSVSQIDSNFGGLGWTTNKLFVSDFNGSLITSKDANLVSKEVGQVDINQQSANLLANFAPTNPLLLDFISTKTEKNNKEIIFIDDTVQVGHIYQYRVCGFDLAGNKSSYAFALVKAEGKKSLRSPINIRAEVLRGYPYRAKITWFDDNVEVSGTVKNPNETKFTISENDVLYRIQRRKFDQQAYETFPLTSNKYLIDEVAASDAVSFRTNIVDATKVDVQNDDAFIDFDLHRPYSIPDYVKENSVYFYRIAVISKIGLESNYSKEFKLSTLTDLSNPINITAEFETPHVKPFVVKLSWGVEKKKSRPDHWVIERKHDNPIDSFKIVGREFLNEYFLDRKVEAGERYIYRIKSVDNLGRESNYFEIRVAT
jgi:hypothetical protein